MDDLFGGGAGRAASIAGLSGARRRWQHSAMGVALAGLAIVPAQAADANWLASPGSGNFNAGTNWSGGAVPDGTAVFGATDTTSITFGNASTTVGGWSFTAGAPAYSFTLGNTNEVIFNGAGIVDAVPGAVTIETGGTLEFTGGSTAGNATITNGANNTLSLLTFSGNSTAGNAIINNDVGLLFFKDASSAGNAAILNHFNQFLYFNGASTAGNADITNLSLMGFTGTSSAGNADILSFVASFQDSSTAADATITNGIQLLFIQNSTAGNAQLINADMGQVTPPIIDFSGSTGPLNDGNVSAGSIAGIGDFYLGASRLTVGSNGLDTAVSGSISDCGTGGNSCLNVGTSGGGLLKVGTGTLTLSGINAYTGQTVVNGGALSVIGDISSSALLMVNAGGTVGGTGVLPGTQVNGGTVAPGNSIGTITVDGDLAFGADATYAVEVSPGSADRIAVTGTADLSGGTVATSYVPGAYVEKTFAILTAQGGLGGSTFAGLEGTAPAGFTHSLSYDGTTAYLVLDLDLAGMPLSRNQRTVANALGGYFDATGGIQAEFAALDANGLSLASGEVAAGAVIAGIDSSDQFLGLIGNEALAGSGASQSEGGHWRRWGSAYGGMRAVGGNAAAGSHDTLAGTAGVAGGMTWSAEGTLLGLAAGGSHSSFALANAMGGGHSDSIQAGLFGRRDLGNAYVTAAAAYGYHQVGTSRMMFGDLLKGQFQAHSASARIEAGQHIATPAATVTPYAAVQAIAYWLPAYAETGAGSFALAYESGALAVLRAELGARIERVTTLEHGGEITLSGRAGLAANSGAPGFKAGFQALPGTSFAIEGADAGPFVFLADAAATYRDPSGYFASAGIHGQFGNTLSLAATAKVGFVW